ncbi:sialate O-acetylesterase [Mariniphaga sp.]|uniref:sialate O-acetylesterase n=1 Tax=Mariniphaga sp. TaxID=1954475 RepID=UPI003562BAFC
MVHLTKQICISLLLLFFFPFISTGQKTLDLFILAGQSNAQGWMGDAAYYPEDGKELDDSILLNWTFVDNESSGGEWLTMQPQKGRFPNGHFGPEVSFARELKKVGYKPAIFKYTKGATGLARDWKAPGEGGIYDSMVTDLKTAMHELGKQGLEVELRGFIWIQGETDAGDEEAAKNYYQNLKQLISDLRNNVLHEQDLKIILGVDEQHSFVKERPVVVEAQRRLAEEDSTIEFTSMLGLPKADGTHLTPAGLVEHGKRIFESYTSAFPGKILNYKNYHNYRRSIRNSLLKFQQEKKGRVAFLGGSITYNGGWRDSICNYLQNRFPDTEFEFIAAGIPSMGTTPAAFRLERDVLAGGPVDLLFEEAAVNDATNGRTSLEQIRAMEGIVRHVRNENPATDIVIMHFVDPQKMETYRSGQVPEVIQNHEKVAAHYHIPTINLAKEVTERIDAGEFTWDDDFKNLHPSPFGQEVYFRSMKAFLEKAWAETVAEDDKIETHPLPEPIDYANYDSGKLILAEKAKVINGWKLVENWNPEDGKGTRQNYVNVPMLISQDEGSTLEFQFNGNAVGIAVAAGPDAGVIEFRIDEGDWQKQDLFTKWSSNLHLPWYYTLAAGLPDGEHILQIRFSGEKNPQSRGNVCRIRYFYANN